MQLKNIIGRLVFGELDEDLSQFGRKVEQQIDQDLDLSPVEEFSDLRDLKDLKGNTTGSVRSYRAEKIEKMAFLSIDIMPGMRYFNIHVIPDHHYRLPRYNFEGMVTTKGSQVSMDLYPDHDIVMDFEYVRKGYAGLESTYQAAAKHKLIHPEPSRLAHLRALCSPYFLMGKKIPAEAMADMQGFALAYFAQWLMLYHQAERVSDTEAEAQLRRRLHIARMIIDNDPDRHKVVNVYGEEMTCRMEQAAML